MTPGGPASEAKADALIREVLALVGVAGARASLERVRRTWTPATATMAVVWFAVEFCAARQIEPLTKERRVLLPRAEVIRALASIEIPLGGATQKLTVPNVKKLHQRGAEMAKTAAGRARLIAALVAVRPNFGALPIPADSFIALALRRARITATLT